jgi:uncharacterized protein (TIGR03435 family)
MRIRNPADSRMSYCLLAVGIFGSRSRLGQRIDLLLRGRRTHSVNTSAGDVIVSAIVLCALLLGGSLAPRWIAFAQESSGLFFEVASVRPTPAERSGDDYGSYFRTLPGGRFSAENVSLLRLVMRAYGVDRNQVSSGNWLKSDDRYDIEARADDRNPSFIKASAAGPLANRALQDSRLRTLLENRFKLAVRRETKVASGYALVVAKGGPRLKEPTEVRQGDGSITAGRGRLVAQKVPLSMLAVQLTRLVGRSVADETGIEGVFDFDLEWSPEETPADLAAAPSIFTAIQEQLGLKLESAKGPVKVLVIDHVEKPDAN